jgi:nucleotide-binding universal stress UspA family protein
VIRTILLAVDDSRAAFRAADLAVDLAAALRARVVAVSVLDGALPDAPRPPDASHAVVGVQNHVRRLARQAGIELEVRTVQGHVADQLLQQVRTVRADLVVIGRVDRPGVRLAPVRRTAEQVLEFSEVPVLVVPSGRAKG